VLVHPHCAPCRLPNARYFAPVIFAIFLSSQEALAANTAVCLVNFFSTFLALYLVDRAGRRILLFTGGLGMALFTGLFALFTSPLFSYTTDKKIGIALIIFTAVYVLNFAYSWGPLVRRLICQTFFFPVFTSMCKYH